jgi:hypothetical protein
MKALIVVAFAALALLASPASAQVLRPGFFIGPMGEKKIGDYVWVWRTEKLKVNEKAQIEAPCPTGYVVLGGGYQGVSGASPYGPDYVTASRPSETFDGWILEASGGAYLPVTVTVYATWGPPTK